MRSIIWRSNSARLLLSGAALTILSPALPAFAQDTVDGAGETSTEDTAPLDPEAAQIVAWQHPEAAALEALRSFFTKLASLAV